MDASTSLSAGLDSNFALCRRVSSTSHIRQVLSKATNNRSLPTNHKDHVLLSYPNVKPVETHKNFLHNFKRFSKDIFESNRHYKLFAKMTLVRKDVESSLQFVSFAFLSRRVVERGSYNIETTTTTTRRILLMGPATAALAIEQARTKKRQLENIWSIYNPSKKRKCIVAENHTNGASNFNFDETFRAICDSVTDDIDDDLGSGVFPTIRWCFDDEN
jgi:hypothetical protein